MSNSSVEYGKKYKNRFTHGCLFLFITVIGILVVAFGLVQLCEYKSKEANAVEVETVITDVEKKGFEDDYDYTHYVKYYYNDKVYYTDLKNGEITGDEGDSGTIVIDSTNPQEILSPVAGVVGLVIGILLLISAIYIVFSKILNCIIKHKKNSDTFIKKYRGEEGAWVSGISAFFGIGSIIMFLCLPINLLVARLAYSMVIALPCWATFMIPRTHYVISPRFNGEKNIVKEKLIKFIINEYKNKLILSVVFLAVLLSAFVVAVRLNRSFTIDDIFSMFLFSSPFLILLLRSVHFLSKVRSIRWRIREEKCLESVSKKIDYPSEPGECRNLYLIRTEEMSLAVSQIFCANAKRDDMIYLLYMNDSQKPYIICNSKKQP